MDEEYIAKNKELDKLKNKQARAEKVSKSKNIWILKPGENTNRGIGITVQTQVEDIKNIIDAKANVDERTFIL